MDQSKDDDSFKIIELIKNGNDIYIHIGMGYWIPMRMSAEMVKTARSRVLTGGAASIGSPESRATPS